MLRTKLFQAFAGLAVTLAILSTLIGVRMIRSRVLNEAQNQVVLDLNIAWAIVNSELNRLDTILEMAAMKRAVVDAATLSAWDDPDVRGRLEAIRRHFGLDFLSVVAPDGRAMIRTCPPFNQGDSMLHNPAVARALNGEKVHGFMVMTSVELAKEAADLVDRAYLVIEAVPKARPSGRTFEDRGLVMIAAAPIMRGPQLLGAMYAGVLLNRNNELVDRIANTIYGSNRLYKGSPVGTATLFLGDCRIATTVLLPNGNRALGTRAWKEVAERTLDSAMAWIGPAFVVKDWYLTAYDPIRDLDGRVVGMLYVGRLQRPYLDVGRALMARFAVLLVLGVAGSLGLAFLLANRLAAPIHQLVLAAERMKRGEPHEPVQVKSSCREIENLVESFNMMAQALEERESRLREARDTLSRQNEEILALNRSYMDMLGFVSHELKSPVGAILNYAFLLKQQRVGSLTPQQEKAVRSIEHNAKRIVEMVRHYLNLSRIENRELTPIRTRVRVVPEVLVPLLESVEEDLRQRKMVVEQSIPEHIVLHADLNMTREVFENLLSNAIKYGREGGRIWTKAQKEDGFVRFVVGNEGPGIPPERMPHLFEKFSRWEPSGTTSREKGTGLGLFITKHVVEAHGGQITVRSQPGEWVEFEFTLPVEKEVVS